MPDILSESESYRYNLLGVANLFLDVLYHDTQIEFDYNVPIINQQGEIAGKLRVKLTRLNEERCFSNASESDSVAEAESKRNKIKCRLTIVEAYDLPFNLNCLVFCKYRFWGANHETPVKQLRENVHTQQQRSILKINHQKEFDIETNEDFFDHCLDGSLSIEVLSHRLLSLSPQEQISSLMSNKNLSNQKSVQNEISQMTHKAKYQMLVDSWNEVSKSFELGVKILELNTEGSASIIKNDPFETFILTKNASIFFEKSSF